MYDKVAAVFAAIALGAAGYAVFQTGQMAGSVSRSAAIADAGGGNTAVVDAAAIERYVAENPLSDAVIEAYLRENPEVIISALEQYQRDQRIAQQEQQAQADEALVADNAEEIFRDGYSLVAGNPEGDITVVEFSDYNCGYCKRAHTEVAKFIENDGNIRLVIKEFPILGPGSTLAGRAALASAMQQNGEKYEEFNDALMKHRGSHTEATVLEIAEEIGLDADQLQSDMESAEIDAMMKRTFELADKLSINGTPAFVIGNQVVRGFVPAEELEKLAETARAS